MTDIYLNIRQLNLFPYSPVSLAIYFQVREYWWAG